MQTAHYITPMAMSVREERERMEEREEGEREGGEGGGREREEREEGEREGGEGGRERGRRGRRLLIQAYIIRL